MAKRYGLDGQTLRKQYKEKISNFRTWDQADHAEEYLLFPQNLGKDLALDETSLSNGDVYTILTNKGAHGKKGALVAIVRGVSASCVIEILRKMEYSERCIVETITTDLSSAMMLIVKSAFPKATLINDRFHVQKLMMEAVDQIRIAYRWEVLEQENKQISEHREKRKAAKTKEERDAIGPWIPMRYANGETLPQILAKSKFVINKHCSKWNDQQKRRAKILFKLYPKLAQAYELCMKLTDIYNMKCKIGVARLSLARWYNEVEALCSKQFGRVLETFRNHEATIVNYFTNRHTNAAAESFNAKIKAFRSQLRGVSDVKFFMFRLATQYA